MEDCKQGGLVVKYRLPKSPSRPSPGRHPSRRRFRAAPPGPGSLSGVRLRVEFTTEPFDLEEAPAHAVAAREVIQTAQLDAVDVGPFGNTAEGESEAVLTAVSALLRHSLEAGATRVSLQVNVIGGDTP